MRGTQKWESSQAGLPEENQGAEWWVLTSSDEAAVMCVTRNLKPRASQRQDQPSLTSFNYFRVRNPCFVNMPDVYAFVYFDFLFVLFFVVVDDVVLVKL